MASVCGQVVQLKVVVGIATVGRASILAETLREVRRQTRQPDRLLVCYAAPADVAGLPAAELGADLLRSVPGSCHQRNAILAAATDCDLVVFFDDDFLPDPDYLAVMERVFTAAPRVVVATGDVLADGIGGPGFSIAQGRAILGAHAGRPTATLDLAPTFCGYGCNMAIRAEPVRRHGILLDERLPLYGWQEDADFTRRLGAHGDIVRVAAARGVHLGVKLGRTPGRRLGYSQVANPLYIARKGSYSLGHALAQISRNVMANSARALWPEPYIDRIGRLRGNLLALRDLLAGKLLPERALDL